MKNNYSLLKKTSSNKIPLLGGVRGGFKKTILLAIVALLPFVGWGQTLLEYKGAAACADGTSAAWNTNANWCAGAKPTSGTYAQFNCSSGAGCSSVNKATTMSIGSTAQTLAGVEITNLRNNNFTINSTSGTPAISLEGGTINGESNVILRNGSAQTMTLNTTYTVALTTNTDFVVDLDGAGDINISSVITGTSKNLIKTGAGSGVLTLSGTNSFTGVTSINEGTVGVATINDASANGPLGANASTTLGGGTLSYTGGTAASTRQFTLSTGTTSTIGLTGTTPTLTLSGAISGAGGFALVGGANTRILLLSGTNTYTGVTTLTSGTLQAGSNQAFGVNSAVTIPNSTTGILNLNSFNNSIGSLAGGGSNGSVVLGSATLTIGGDNTSTSFAGVISGTGGLTKVGTGTLTLQTTSNTYTGPTTVSGGTLILDRLNVIHENSNVVLNGGTLSSGTTAGLNKNSAGTGTLQLTDNSTIALGTGSHTFKFAASDLVAWTADKILTVTGWSGTAGLSGTAGQIFVGSNATGLTEVQLASINFTGYTAGATILSTGELVPVGTFYWGGTGAESWTVTSGTRWGTDDITFDTDWLSGSNAIFNTPGSTITGATTAFNNLTANVDVTVTPSGTLGTKSKIATITVADTKTLDFSTQDLSTSAGTGFIKAGLGTFKSSNTGAYPGGFTLSAGKMVIGSLNAMGSGGALALNSGTLAATGGLKTLGTRYSGISIGGDITLGDATNNSDISMSNDVSLGGATRTITLGSTGTYTLGGIISNGGLTVNNTAAGTLVLSGTNSYTGVTALNGGTVSVSTIGDGGVAGNLGQATNASANLVLGGGTLNYSGATASTDRGFTLSSGTSTFRLSSGTATTLTLSGMITGSGALTIRASHSSSALLLSNNSNDYTGAITVGVNLFPIILRATNPNVFGNCAAYTTVTSSTLDLNNNSNSIGSIAGGNGGTGITLGSGTLTVGCDNSSTSFTGVITGTGGLIKVGSGALTLGAASTYSGTTTITEGTLVLNYQDAISKNANVVLNGGTLSSGTTAGFFRTSSGTGTLQLTDNSNIVLGTGAHTLNFANSNAVAWTSGKTLTITGWAGTPGVTGTEGKIFFGTDSLGLIAAQLAQISFAGYTSTRILSTGEIVPLGNFYWGGTAAESWTATSGTRWSTDEITYATNWTSGNHAIFNISNSTITGGNTEFTSITANENVTVTPASTIGSNRAAAIITVAADKTFDWGNQVFSVQSGTGFIKNGAGTLKFGSTGGSAYPGGFTLNAGTVLFGGAVNSIGAAAVTINGGTLAATTEQIFTNGKFTTITFGGDFSFGDATNVSNISIGTSTAATSTVALGASERTITLAGTGTYSIYSKISGSGGITLSNSSVAGTLFLGSLTSDFTGLTKVNGGIVNVSTINNASTAGPLGANASTTLGGGTLTYSGATASSTRNFTLTDLTTSTINLNTGTPTLTISGVISGTGNINLTGNANRYLELSGTNTYTGSTIVTTGNLIISGNNATDTIVCNGGELRLTADDLFTDTDAHLILNGGKFRDNHTTIGYAQTLGTLELTNNSTLALGSGAHDLHFANSSATPWTIGKKLTITGWTGVVDYSSSGTDGRVFVGTDATGLTVDQLAQIFFTTGGNTYEAMILGTGEVIPSGVGTVSSDGTTKFMSYNLLGYSHHNGGINNGGIKNKALRNVFATAQADIIGVQELNGYGSGPQWDIPYQALYDSTLDNSVYNMADFINTPTGLNVHLYYNKAKFNFISTTAHSVLPAVGRNIDEFKLINISTDDTISVFVAHFSPADDATARAERAAQTAALRAVTDAFPVNYKFFVMGDFNIYRDTEDGYQNLVNTGNTGYFVDPTGINLDGDFEEASDAVYHTQCSRVRKVGNGATGGLNSRFDYILHSKAVEDGDKIVYVNSYPYGNNGNLYNDSVNNPSNVILAADVLQALFDGSDHLPMIAEYQFTGDIIPVDTLYWGGTGAESWIGTTGDIWSEVDGTPYTTQWAPSSYAFFNVPNSTITGGVANVQGIVANENVTVTAGGTLTIYPKMNITVASGKTFDFQTQAFSTNATSSYIKNGEGTLAIGGNSAWAGEFTLDAGTIIALSNDGIGGGGKLIINGGTIAADASRDFSGTKGTGIFVGGNFTLGATTGLALSSADLIFNNNVALYGSQRTITIGGTGTYTLGGIISNGGLIVNSTAAGTLLLSGANTYTDTTTVTSGTLALGATNAIHKNSVVVLNGGILSSGTSAGYGKASTGTGTLLLTDNSTLALGTGAHILYFANSSTETWTVGKTLNITGWTGTAGSSGTAGRIFVGTNMSSLTGDQLAQITFSGYTGTAKLIAGGELVPDFTAADMYWNGTGTWTTASTWAVTEPTYDQTWASGNNAIFNVASSTITGATTAFTNITANENVTVTAGGTISITPTTVITVAAGKALNFQGQVFSASPANSGYTKDGDGELALDGNASWTGNFVLNAGRITVSSVNSMGGGGTLTINGGTIAGSVSKDFSNKFSSIAVNGDFTLGAIDGLASSTANLKFNAPMDFGGATRTITIGNTGRDTLIGIISNGGLTVNSTAAGIISLVGANTFTGLTTINGGTVSVDVMNNISTDGPLGNNTSTTLGGGKLRYRGATASTDRAFTLTDATTSIFDVSSGTAVLTVSGAISGTGNYNIDGATGGVLLLTGTNTYTGSATITGGTLRAGSTSAFGTCTPVILANTSTAIFDINNLAIEIASLAGGATGTNNVTLGTGTLTFCGAGATYNGRINGTGGSLVMSGSGTQTLAGINTYTGDITVNSGKLTLTGSNSTTGTITVVGGTLESAAANSLATGSSVTVQSGGTLLITENQTLANVTLEAGAILTVVNGKVLKVTGTHTVDVTAVINGGGETGTIEYNGTGVLVYSGAGTKTSGKEWGTAGPPVTVTIQSPSVVELGQTSAIVSGTGVDHLFINSGATLNAKTFSIQNPFNVQLSGILITENMGAVPNLQGGGVFTSATIIFNAGSTVEYNGGNGQIIQGTLDYTNLTVAGSGTKTLSSAIDVINGTLLIKDGVTLDAQNRKVGAATDSIPIGRTKTLLTMEANSAFITGGGTGALKPDAGGVYNIACSSTITFLGTSGVATGMNIRLDRTYGNIIIAGTVVGSSSTSGTIDMCAGTTFTVNSGATFTVVNSNGLIGSATNTFIKSTDLAQVVLAAGSTISYPNTTSGTPVGSQTITPLIYSNITIDGTGTKTATSAFTVNGTFTVSGTATLAGTSPTYGVNGGLAYVSSTLDKEYITGLEWPTTAAPKNVLVNLSDTVGSPRVTLSENKALPSDGVFTRTKGIVNINGNTLTLNNTASGALVNGGGTNGYFVGDLSRAVVDGNTYSYPLGIGLVRATGNRHFDFVNTSSGIDTLKVSAASVNETGSNVDGNITANQGGTYLSNIAGSATGVATIWTTTPNAAPAGNYSIKLYTQNIAELSGNDNKFYTAERTDTTSYANWVTKEATSTIPATSDPGRIYDNGNGYAERTFTGDYLTGVTQFAIGVRGCAVSSSIATFSAGPWGNTGTWVGNVVPDSLDAVTINHHVSLTGSRSCSNLTISSGAGVDITGSGDLTIKGNLSDNSGGAPFAGTYYFKDHGLGGCPQTISGVGTRVKDIVINNPQGVEILSGSDVSVIELLTLTSGDLTVNGTLELETDATINGLSGNIIGNVTLNRNYTATGCAGSSYIQVTNPITNSFNDAGNWKGWLSNGSGNAAFSPIINWPNLYTYVETNTNSGDAAYTALDSSASMERGKGYFIYVMKQYAGVPSNKVVTTTGALSFDDYAWPLTYTAVGDSSSEFGFNMLGNPFPGDLNADLNNATYWSKTDSVYSAVYIWNGCEKAYSAYIGGVISGATGFVVDVADGNVKIPYGSAFWVNRGSGGFDTLTVKRAALMGTARSIFKKVKPRNVLQLAIAKDGLVKSQTAIRFHNDGTVDFDGNYDALQFGYPTTHIYSEMDSKAGNKRNYAINTLPFGQSGNGIALRHRVSALSKYRLVISGMELFDDNTCIYIIDTKTNTIINPRKTEQYEFVEDKSTDYKSRFIVKTYGKADPVVIGETCGKDGQAVFNINVNSDFSFYNSKNELIKSGTTQDSVKFNNLTAGNYYVTLKSNEFTCPVAIQEFTVPEFTPLQASFSKRIDAACEKNNGIIKVEPTGGNQPYSYLWSNDETTNEITDLKSGLYTVTVTDAKGCIKKSNPVSIANVKVKADFELSNTLVLINKSQLMSAVNKSENATSYIWNFGNGNIQTTHTPTPVKFESEGEYFVKLVVSTENNCVDSLSRRVTVQKEVIPFTKDKVQVYQKGDAVVVKPNSNFNGTIEIRDVKGMMVYSGKHQTTAETSVEISMTLNVGGVYLVKLSDSANQYTKKLSFVK